MTWREAIIEALKALGGKGNLKNIYEKVEKMGNMKSKIEKCTTWKNTIRQTIYDNSSDSNSFRQKNDLFHHVGHGIWELRNKN
jgi:putative restriction endonuclease